MRVRCGQGGSSLPPKYSSIASLYASHPSQISPTHFDRKRLKPELLAELTRAVCLQEQAMIWTVGDHQQIIAHAFF